MAARLSVEQAERVRFPDSPQQYNAGLAQLVERHSYKVDVAGSNPATCTKLTTGLSSGVGAALALR